MIKYMHYVNYSDDKLGKNLHVHTKALYMKP